jgi:hypothetical protein
MPLPVPLLDLDLDLIPSPIVGPIDLQWIDADYFQLRATVRADQFESQSDVGAEADSSVTVGAVNTSHV